MNGLTGFDRQCKVVDGLKIESSVKNMIKGKLLRAKRYLNGQYKVNVKEELKLKDTKSLSLLVS